MPQLPQQARPVRHYQREQGLISASVTVASVFFLAVVPPNLLFPRNQFRSEAGTRYGQDWDDGSSAMLKTPERDKLPRLADSDLFESIHFDLA
jgi:hypothetical protein